MLPPRNEINKEDGDIINLDVSLYYGGLHADLNETYLIGNVDETGRSLVNCARECLKQAILQGPCPIN